MLTLRIDNDRITNYEYYIKETWRKSLWVACCLNIGGYRQNCLALGSPWCVFNQIERFRSFQVALFCRKLSCCSFAILGGERLIGSIVSNQILNDAIGIELLPVVEVRAGSLDASLFGFALLLCDRFGYVFQFTGAQIEKTRVY